MLGAGRFAAILCSYATIITLAHLTDPATLGRYNLIQRAIGVPNTILYQTLLFTVSKLVAAEGLAAPASERRIRRRGLLVATAAGLGVFAVLFAGARGISRLLHDPSMAPVIRVAAIVPLLFAVFAVNIGTLNAMRRLHAQALLNLVLNVTRTVLSVAAAAAGFGLVVIVGGFVGASVTAVALSVLWVARSTRGVKTDVGPSRPAVARTAGVIASFTCVTTLLLPADLIMLSLFAASSLSAGGIGFYSTAQLLALVPFVAVQTVTLTLFPAVSMATARREPGETRAQFQNAIQVALLLALLMASVISSSADGILAVLFPHAYSGAASQLTLMVWGYSGYALCVMTAWLSIGRSRSVASFLLVGSVLATVIAAGLAWIPSEAEVGAARAVFWAGVTGVVGSLVVLWTEIRVTVPLRFVAKLVAASIAVVALGRSWEPETAAEVVVKIGVLALVFGGLAVATRAVDLRRRVVTS